MQIIYCQVRGGGVVPNVWSPDYATGCNRLCWLPLYTHPVRMVRFSGQMNYAMIMITVRIIMQ